MRWGMVNEAGLLTDIRETGDAVDDRPGAVSVDRHLDPGELSRPCDRQECGVKHQLGDPYCVVAHEKARAERQAAEERETLIQEKLRQMAEVQLKAEGKL